MLKTCRKLWNGSWRRRLPKIAKNEHKPRARCWENSAGLNNASNQEPSWISHLLRLLVELPEVAQSRAVRALALLFSRKRRRVRATSVIRRPLFPVPNTLSEGFRRTARVLSWQQFGQRWQLALSSPDSTFGPNDWR